MRPAILGAVGEMWAEDDCPARAFALASMRRLGVSERACAAVAAMPNDGATAATWAERVLREERRPSDPSPAGAAS